MVISALAAANKAAEHSTPLPYIQALDGLYAAGNRIHMGGVVMIAGPPGARKTMFTLWLVNELNLAALYFSCDSDAAVMCSRLAAMRMRISSATARDMLRDPTQKHIITDVLKTSKINFSYHPAPGVLDIEDEINAWVEMWDEYPPIIVIDNLLDMSAEGGDGAEHSRFKEILKELKTLARDTGSCVIVLHHMLESGEYGSSHHGSLPKPRSALSGKVSQTPAQIFSVNAEGNRLHLAVVKDRNGPNDPTANKYLTLQSDPDQCWFGKIEWNPSHYGE